MTVTSTVPATVPAGLVTLMDVPAWFTVKLAASTLVVPKSTSVAPVKLLPVIVTGVPPASGPLEGLTPVTDGADTAELDQGPSVMVSVVVLAGVGSNLDGTLG